jgi:hypothetical protein
MAHLYDKLPPAFAKDPWAWDYTRDRMEGNTGLAYPDWEGKHFAGAAAMYKNVVKKYAGNIAAGNITVPRECVDCGQTNAHYVDDYVCRDCRDLIENASSYAEATSTITRPEALDDIRDQLYKALGHDKKDAKKAKTAPMGPGSVEFEDFNSDENGVPSNAGKNVVIQAPAAIPYSGANITTGQVSRNYGAMNEDKLIRSIRELEAGEGEAMKKIKPGEDSLDHLEAALRVAQEKGISA